MKSILYFVAGWLLLFPNSLVSQNFPIGHRTLTFTDPARSNRAVPCEVYYPGEAAGNNVTVAVGQFPVISFGHGFLMVYSAYRYLADSLVPKGYILVFTKTESGFSPSHSEFGKDLTFLVTQMKTEGITESSPFYDHVDTTSAVMGHSMGGGASFLGCADSAVSTVIVTFAAAETTPSAIQAATRITMPSLVFSADQDCVTPPAQNQLPMYDSLASPCKVFINIKGGGHCYFAGYNFQCSLGEISCQQNFTITREEQHATTLDFLVPYLGYYLKKDTSLWTAFNDSLESSSRITYRRSCSLPTGIRLLPEGKSFQVFPNPAGDQLVVRSLNPNEEITGIVIRTVTGIILNQIKDSGAGEVEVNGLSKIPPGIYILGIEGKNRREITKLVRN